MYNIKYRIIIISTMLLTFGVACHDLDELNINPNGVDPATADLNLLMATIETGIGQQIVSLGFGDIAGVMQHTQKDGWSSGHNDYDWNNQGGNWSSYYGILRNNDEFYQKAADGEYTFHQGVALVMRSYAFGLIADLWGDAPYSEALLAEEGPDYFKPAYEGQKEIYMGIFADLESANTLLSQDPGSYENVNSSQDLIYGGDASKWRKFANSLALRYYMRLSAKEPATAQEGISKITSEPAKYPLITDAADDANISYIGNSPSDSWPSNTVFDTSPSGSYMRIKLCGTFVNVLKGLNDPRLGVWANQIGTPLVLVSGTGVDVIINGQRNVSQDIVDDYEASWGVGVDYDPAYVGIPPSVFAASQYNLNPNLDQGVFNPHASQLNDIYKDASGDLLLMRIMSAAEVHFILSEAALNGWGSGTAEGHYNAGVQQSMNAWGVGGDFNDYIAGAPYAGLESIIQQKWISSWTAAAESWFDYRRTGLPNLQAGESAQREKLPLRFYYNFDNEIALNEESAAVAIGKLEPTAYKGSDVSNNSAWSKTWLLIGTGLPY